MECHLHEYKCYKCGSGPDLLSAFLEEDYPALLLQALRHKVGANKEEETAKVQSGKNIVSEQKE